MSIQDDQISEDEFSHYFFEVIRILDGKEKDPYTDFLANTLFEQGMYLGKKELLRRLNSYSIVEQAKEIGNWHCLKSQKDDQEKFVHKKLIQRLKEKMDPSLEAQMMEKSENYQKNSRY